MKMKFLPTTKLGKWSVGFNILFLILLVYVSNIQPSVYYETFYETLLIGIPMVIALISGIVAAIIGIIAVVEKDEHSLLVYFSILIGTIILIFLTGDLVSPS